MVRCALMAVSRTGRSRSVRNAPALQPGRCCPPAAASGLGLQHAGSAATLHAAATRATAVSGDSLRFQPDAGLSRVSRDRTRWDRARRASKAVRHSLTTESPETPLTDAVSMNFKHDSVAPTAIAARRLAHRPDLEDSLSSTNGQGLRPVHHAVPEDSPSWFPGHPTAQEDCCPSHERMTRTPEAD